MGSRLKISIVTEVLQELKDLCAEKEWLHTAILTYLIVAHHQCLDTSNVHLAQIWDKTHPALLSTVGVSREAARIVRDMSLALDIRSLSVVSFIVKENLFALRSLPETFIGLDSIKLRSVDKMQLCLYQDIFDYAKTLATVSGDGERSLNVTEYITLLLESLSMDEILYQTQDIDLSEFSARMSGLLVTRVRVPINIHSTIKALARQMGRSMTLLTSFLLWREMYYVHQELPKYKPFLPESLKQMYENLLKRDYKLS